MGRYVSQVPILWAGSSSSLAAASFLPFKVMGRATKGRCGVLVLIQEGKVEAARRRRPQGNPSPPIHCCRRDLTLAYFLFISFTEIQAQHRESGCRSTSTTQRVRLGHTMSSSPNYFLLPIYLLHRTYIFKNFFFHLSHSSPSHNTHLRSLRSPKIRRFHVG